MSEQGPPPGPQGALGLLSAYDSASDDENVPVTNDATAEEPPAKQSKPITAPTSQSNQQQSPPTPIEEKQPLFVNFRSGTNEDEIDLSSAESSSSSESDSEADEGSQQSPTGLKKKAPKTKGELTMDDLPPIDKLTLEAPIEQLVHLGRVVHILDRLVTIQAFKDIAPLDIDSVLFLRDGLPLGKIFEVFGPVVEPMYLVRFNSMDEITQRGIVVDMPVYYGANFQAPITSFVFTDQLLKMRGTDASWKDNNEPPDEVRDFSDDEEERLAKQRQRSKPMNFNSSPATIVPPNTPNQSHLQQQYQACRPNWFYKR